MGFDGDSGFARMATPAISRDGVALALNTALHDCFEILE